MSDDQNKDNLPGQEPEFKGGWYQPTEPSLWKTQQPKDTGMLATEPMPAFPEDLNERPREQGGWHRPSPGDTVLKPESTITKGEPIVVEPPPSSLSSSQPSPEDMINEILGISSGAQTEDSLVAPEDFVLTSESSAEAEALAPEDLVTDFEETAEESDVEEEEQPEAEEIDEDELEDELEEDVENILGNLDELTDDPFSEDERTALMSMMDEDEPVTDETIDESVEDSDALYQKIKKITDELPELTQEQIDKARTPTPPETVDDTDDAAEFAKRMLQQYEEEEDMGSVFGGLASGQVDLGEKANTSASTDAADYARQQLEQLGGDEGEATGYSDAYGTQPYGTQQQAPELDPQVREMAERFRNVENQVATLNMRYQNEEMTYDEYQRLLYELAIQDENGAWWMIGANSDKWYRHDPYTNQWTEDTPEALAILEDYEASRDDAGYPPQDEDITLPPIYGSDSEQDSRGTGSPIYDDYGVQQGVVPPTVDDQYTVPSDAAWANTLPDQQVTMPNEPANYEATVRSPSVDTDDYGRTVPSASVAAENATIQSAVDRSAPGTYSFDEPAPTVEAARQEQQSNTLRLVLLIGAGVFALGLVTVIVVAVGIAFWYSNSVEPYRDQIAALANYNPPFQTARIYDASGNLIVELNSQETGARTAVPLSEMSPFVIHAVISQENERYYQDPGFDPIAIARAFFQNIVGGTIESGASTITQQIAKNLVLQDTDITAERKINEILVALEIANQYDKNFILELYLNEVFFGNQSYGVEAASQFYFEHGADELNFTEAALLASIIPSPALNDPVVNRPSAIRAMRDTMHKMLDVGCLQFQHGDWLSRGPFCVTTQTQVDFEGDSVLLVRTNRAGEINGGLAALQIAEIETAEFEPRNVRLRYPHFVNFIQSEIEAEYGTNALFQRGFNIYTTLNPGVQELAQESLTRQVANLVETGVNTGAVMVTDPSTGAIRAMVGSHDFSDDVAGQVNNVLTYQQPGSAIKPVVYTAAIVGNQGRYLTPASILWDVPVTYDLGGSTYTPVNFDRRYYGAVPLRFALQNSYNISAVKTYEFIGNERFIETAQALGLQFPEGAVVGLASALGANEVRLFDMMEAYGTLANGGQRNNLYAIERITETVDGQEVTVPMEPRPEAVQAVSPQTAYLMTNILSDDNARRQQFGVNSQLTLARMGYPTQNFIAAKTGTSNDSRDLWTMGYTRQTVVGVWLGTYDNSPTFNTTGFNSAAPVWNVVMESALAGRRPTEYTNPGGVIAQEICRTTGTLSYPNCPERTTDIFIRDKLPPPPSEGFVQTIAIDSWTGLRANEFCDDYVVERTFANISDRSAIEWLNTSTAGRAYAQAVGLPIPLQNAPTEFCSQGQGLPSVGVTLPNPNQTIQGQFTVQGQVNAPNFARYELLYAPAQQPNNFVQITSSTGQVQVNGSPLGNWDTTQVPNGNYILRLLAISTVGGQIRIDVPVTVNNPIPTPTPTVIPTVEPALVPSAGDAVVFPDVTVAPGGGD